MLLENNGKVSRGKRTKHINIKYYFVTDSMVKKDISMEYCPTSDMYRYFIQGSHKMYYTRLNVRQS